MIYSYDIYSKYQTYIVENDFCKTVLIYLIKIVLW